MFTGIAIALIVLGAGYGLYQMVKGSSSQSGDLSLRRKQLPSIFTDGSSSGSSSTGSPTSGAQSLQGMASGDGLNRRAEWPDPATTASAALLNANREELRPITAVGSSNLQASSAFGSGTVEAASNSTGAETTATLTSVGSSSKSRPLFAEFDGILNRRSGGPDSRIRPESLPMPEDDMVFGSVTPALAEMLPESETRRELQRKNLLAAGYHSRAAWINLNAVRFVLAFLALVISGFWLLMAPPQLEMILLGTVVLLPLLLWAVPPLVVGHQAAERRIDIERGLPDVLDMLNMGVSQGLTVPKALSRITREIAPAHPALSQELSIVSQQASVGSLSTALRGFSSRIDSPEVNSFTSLLMQAEATGTSISQALRDYSDSMRSSLRERADTQANSAAFKLLFPTTLCLMPSVFLFLLGPAIVDMTNFFDNTAGTILENRAEAVQSLELQPVAVPDSSN
ncbi:MAG: type II secretion system F family protein [Planctomycetaceae bacterium]|nr:type II secretion system F family protein [Planctomycetaceae bacterium]